MVGTSNQSVPELAIDLLVIFPYVLVLQSDGETSGSSGSSGSSHTLSAMWTKMQPSAETKESPQWFPSKKRKTYFLQVKSYLFSIKMPKNVPVFCSVHKIPFRCKKNTFNHWIISCLSRATKAKWDRALEVLQGLRQAGHLEWKLATFGGGTMWFWDNF